MKRLLFLLPLLLIVLNVLSVSVEKDNVQLNSSSKTLTPSSWQTIHSHTQQLPIGSVFVPNANLDPNSKAEAKANPVTLTTSTSASYHGFPFGAYVKRSDTNQRGTVSFTAWSWIWAAADIAIVLISLILAIALNRRHKERLDMQHNPAMPQPQTMPAAPTHIDYQLPQPVVPHTNPQPPQPPQPPYQPPAGPPR